VLAGFFRWWRRILNRAGGAGGSAQLPVQISWLACWLMLLWQSFQLATGFQLRTVQKLLQWTTNSNGQGFTADSLLLRWYYGNFPMKGHHYGLILSGLVLKPQLRFSRIYHQCSASPPAVTIGDFAVHLQRQVFSLWAFSSLVFRRA